MALINDLNETYELTYAEDLPLIVDDINNSIIPANFIGLQGYKAVFSDGRILIALINTLVFTGISVALELVLGLGLALILIKAIFGHGFVGMTSLILFAFLLSFVDLLLVFFN